MTFLFYSRVPVLRYTPCVAGVGCIVRSCPLVHAESTAGSRVTDDSCVGELTDRVAMHGEVEIGGTVYFPLTFASSVE